MTGPSLPLIREKAVYAIGTMDTKGEELSFLGDAIRETGMPVHLVDVGTGGPPQCQPCISRQAVAEFASESEKLQLATGEPPSRR